MTLESLVPFVQDQFRRGGHWSWETVIEEVASHLGIVLDADRMTYACGTICTGRYFYECNNAAWRKTCALVIDTETEAHAVLLEISCALQSRHADGVASSWLSRAEESVKQGPAEYRGYFNDFVGWQNLVYRCADELSPELSQSKSIVYGLWRVDGTGHPISPLPSYIGETSGTMIGRIERPPMKCHRDWWGDGKPIGITLALVEPDERKAIESYLIDVILPFCNVGNRLSHRFRKAWTFPRPD